MILLSLLHFKLSKTYQCYPTNVTNTKCEKLNKWNNNSHVDYTGNAFDYFYMLDM